MSRHFDRVGCRRTFRAVNRKGAVDPKLFDGIARRLSRVGSRRAMVGGALSAAIFAAAGIPTDAPAKRARTEACLPQGRRCGTRKGDESCKRCCQRYFVTNDKGRRKCACRPVSESCNNSAQCCTGNCQNNVCVPGSPACTEFGLACAANSDCCSGICGDGICRAIPCTNLGGTCQNNGNCCSSTCGDGICQPVVCSNIGSICATNANCCSNICALSFFEFTCRKPNCVGDGASCQNDSDCCEGVCEEDSPGVFICFSCGCPPATP